MGKLYKFGELQRKDQIKCHDAFELMKEFNEFQNRATLSLFKHLFEERADYMWEQFVTKHNRQIMALMNASDISIQSAILTNIVMNRPRDTSGGNELYFNA